MYSRYYRSLTVSILALMTAGAVHAQSAPPGKSNLLTLSASQSVQAPQDYLQITLSATKTGSNGATVQNELKTIVDTALAQARTGKNDEVKVKTHGFRVVPVYDNEQRLRQWQGTASLVVEGKDMVGVSTLAANLKNMTVVHTGFELSSSARIQYELQAQKMAVDDFRAKAQLLTEQFGFATYTLDNIQVTAANEFARPMRAMAMESNIMAKSASPIPVEAGETTITMHVNGTIQMFK